ncbi:protein regulator of cytokinesis 1-like isoform X3 [Babylonia areolata]|uniref:protein regulator of cytokinesis 1-like isoform X3 n=1 Tax=Babylonia areolata TaxID=304850 RepID=UPI003FD4FB32
MSSSSKKKVKEEVTRRLEVTLEKLYRIWNEIGIDEGQVANRAGTVSIHLCNLMDEMVSEEEQLHEQMAINIQRFVDELSTLCLELAVSVPKVSEQLSMVQREKELRTKLENLNREKQERLKKLKQLLDQDQALCQALCSTPFYVSSVSVPTREQLQELESHIKTLELEKEKRYREFLSTKQKVVALCNGMDYDPDTSFERDLICEDDDAFQLSAENMESLKSVLHDLERKNRELKQQVEDLWVRIHALWDRLELPQPERTEFESRHAGHKHSVLSGLRDEILRCEQLKFENLQRFIEGARRELVDCWNQCYFSKEQRDAFVHYLDETYTEELLEVHEQELQKMRDYYKTHEHVLSLMARRDKLWKEMLEFEKNASDPNRFFNDRGGKLLREEKARKKLMKDLPKVEEEVRLQIECWEKEQGKTFLVEGVPFVQYINTQWAVFKEQKEHEKVERQKNKVKQMEEEMIFGSKPTATTPAKRRFMNTPTRTPLKARKLNETPRTPSSISRIQHSSVFHSPYGRPPLSTTKTPNMNHTKRRRSLRQARKHLQESLQNTSSNNNSRSGRKKTAGKNNPDLFSQTTAKLKTSSSSHPGNSTTLSWDSDKSKKSTGRRA